MQINMRPSNNSVTDVRPLKYPEPRTENELYESTLLIGELMNKKLTGKQSYSVTKRPRSANAPDAIKVIELYERSLKAGLRKVGFTTAKMSLHVGQINETGKISGLDGSDLVI